MTVIRAMNLSKRYGGTTAVADLSFDVKPGLVTGFLGPNGAGKPTIKLGHIFAALSLPISLGQGMNR
ncbi:hypothetical protein GCM10017559_45010 [Streptosporangium longisporum]|uniref:ABC transporter domain-containing protein n=1 Tax=Streptosporangium longisporum TaxID=46187 RepID=A0ABN3Y9W3_9ACTN